MDCLKYIEFKRGKKCHLYFYSVMCTAGSPFTILTIYICEISSFELTWMTMYSTVMGAKTARNRGVLYAITIGTHSTRKRHVNQAWKLIAIRVSITSMSLLKRFKIRPPGVLSKKDIGDATMFLKILKCTLRPALTLPMNSEILAAIINTPRNTNLFIYYCKFN